MVFPESFNTYSELIDEHKKKVEEYINLYVKELVSFFNENYSIFREIELSKFFRYVQNQNSRAYPKLKNLNRHPDKDLRFYEVSNNFFWNHYINKFTYNSGKAIDEVSSVEIFKRLDTKEIFNKLRSYYENKRGGINFGISENNVSNILLLACSRDLDIKYSDFSTFNISISLSEELFEEYKKRSFEAYFAKIALLMIKKEVDVENIISFLKDNYALAKDYLNENFRSLIQVEIALSLLKGEKNDFGS